VTPAADCRKINTMPAAQSSRQPSRAEARLASVAVRGLVRRCLRDAAPEVARFSGRYGLFVDPHADERFVATAPNLHTQLHLQRSAGGYVGDLQCSESAIPIVDESLALIVLTCAFEAARDPVGLAAECARMLEPEGTLLVLGLNPWSPAHLRWMLGGLRVWSPEATGALLSGLGLEIVGWQFLGARWSAGKTATIDVAGKSGRGSLLRSGFLLEARRRDPGLTPIRAKARGLRLGQRTSAG
jgi:hypothetical protein